MGFNCFTHLIVHRPYVILAVSIVLTGTCFMVPFTLNRPLPDFSDPQAGFSTRGTTISNRLIAWENLVKSTKPSGPFAINPRELLFHHNATYVTKPNMKAKKPHKKKNKKPDKAKVMGIYIHTDTSNRPNYQDNNKWKALKNIRISSEEKLNNKLGRSGGFFCGNPDERYAHAVVKSLNNKDLFSLNSLMTLCLIEEQFIEADHYKELCSSNTKHGAKCCKPWSLGNYIALLHNRASCLAITEKDVNATRKLLEKCSTYFHNLQLMPDCVDKGYCDVPSECIKHDAVFNILNFLTSTSFLNGTSNNKNILLETMIFLPIACSSTTLPYYHSIENKKLEFDGISVVAMEFGIKTALFNECLIRDAWLMSSSAIFVFFCMALYTESIFLTFMTIIAIVLALGVSYFLYSLVFEINFFPFMNLLAIIVVIGIGSDDAFIFCKMWQMIGREKSISFYKMVESTFQHAFLSMSVTTLTTAAAFFASYSSSVTAIACFSIFAGTAVVVNFVLMITWFPACFVVWNRSWLSKRYLYNRFISVWCMSLEFKSRCCMFFKKHWFAKEKYLIEHIIKYRYIWFTFLSVIALLSSIIVMVYPKLELPTSREFQLFHRQHMFERYDFEYKNDFWFRREEKIDIGSLPMRFVWGVLPKDNGQFLDPNDHGAIVLDPDFDISDPAAQLWLLNFCKRVRHQPFFQPSIGPILPNCFIETFMKSMKRDCINPFSNENHMPCCNASTFPFESSVFRRCIVEEMSEIYETPTQYLIPGMAGPKFSKENFPTISAVIVEYDTQYMYSMSYEYMDEFFTSVEAWMIEELKTAPPTMRNGWFISEFDFYDLQHELSHSTWTAILISMGLALVVLLISTLNILTSLYAILTITCSIFVAVAILVLLGWQLNVLESVAVSTAIGLTVDFSLHYAVNYRLCTIAEDRIEATRYAIRNMAGPSLMAALTTAAAGAFMMPSTILPYIQIGMFLVTVMAVSWTYATLFLGSLLAIAGPERGFGQFYYTQLVHWFNVRRKTSSIERPINDAQEMASLTNQKQHTADSGIGGSRDRYVFNDQSPSALSSITIIMSDN